jgi:hypothetical protein
MILLDTDVVAESFRSQPNANVRDWLDAQRPGDLFLCMPVLAELYYGVEMLPAGSRRLNLESVLRKIEELFVNRTLPFDRTAAHEFGKLVAHRDRHNRTTGTREGLIAAIAKVHGAVIATRNSRGFDGVGLEIVNPFEPSSS